MSKSRIRGVNEEQVMHAMGLDDAYRVERVLASGVAGVTELVTIDGCGPFVRKKMPLALANRGVWARLASAGSDRLPRVAATYEMPDYFVAIYDYIPGPILEQTVRSGGAYPLDEALRLTLEICEAIEALHACGVVHLDITPGNIVVAADGAHVIDLGLARVLSEPAPRTSRPLGTWGFAAPEQCGFGTTDERTDVYAIGKVLAYLLMGESEAFDLPTLDVSEHGEVPAAAREVITRACQMEPSRRYQSVAELAVALEGVGGCGDGGEASSAEASSKAAAGTSAAAGANPAVASPSVGEPVATAAAEKASSAAAAASGAWVEASPKRRALGARKAVAVGLVAVAVVAGACVLVPRLMGQGDDAASMKVATDTSAATSLSAGAATASAPGMSLADVQSLEVLESGWSANDGYVHYGLALRNPNDALVEYPGFRVTGYDKNGAVLFSDEQVLGALGAGEACYYGGQAGNGTKPDRMEFTPMDIADYQVSGSGGATAMCEVNGLSTKRGQYGMTDVGGTVRLVRAGTYGTTANGVAVSIILRDSDGAIVYGDTTFVSTLNEGSESPFSTSIYNAPTFATAEAYAQAW